MGRHGTHGKYDGVRLTGQLSAWAPEDEHNGEDQQGRPRHGNIGPAKRRTVCEDDWCWEPNALGWCKVCGGDGPARTRARGDE